MSFGSQPERERNVAVRHGIWHWDLARSDTKHIWPKSFQIKIFIILKKKGGGVNSAVPLLLSPPSEQKLILWIKDLGSGIML